MQIVREIFTDRQIKSSNNCVYTNAGKIWISNKKGVHTANCREILLYNIIKIYVQRFGCTALFYKTAVDTGYLYKECTLQLAGQN